mmetsp:Transcript_118092/g.338763  ORF Transcript_118092/g.338763 Transcript_118092/m.338763 type:complete len:317 (+) Transcript_118092:387-1337(+)
MSTLDTSSALTAMQSAATNGPSDGALWPVAASDVAMTSCTCVGGFIKRCKALDALSSSWIRTSARVAATNWLLKASLRTSSSMPAARREASASDNLLSAAKHVSSICAARSRSTSRMAQEPICSASAFAASDAPWASLSSNDFTTSPTTRWASRTTMVSNSLRATSWMPSDAGTAAINAFSAWNCSSIATSPTAASLPPPKASARSTASATDRAASNSASSLARESLVACVASSTSARSFWASRTLAACSTFEASAAATAAFASAIAASADTTAASTCSSDARAASTPSVADRFEASATDRSSSKVLWAATDTWSW